MGILNLTPDSFSDGGRYNDMDAALAQTEKMLSEGAAVIDIGGYSSRPGAEHIPLQEELNRVAGITSAILDRFPEALLSVDTFRSEVARELLQTGVHIINDISAGLLDEAMLETVATFDAPYIMMHMPGNPQTMQGLAKYGDVALEVWDHLALRVRAAREAGIKDLVIDPGFGFGKTVAHNYELFRSLDKFSLLGLPLLVGISRKSMLYKPFGAQPDEVLDLASALHLQALEAGASILRVHDVLPAARIVKLHQLLKHGTV